MAHHVRAHHGGCARDIARARPRPRIAPPPTEWWLTLLVGADDATDADMERRAAAAVNGGDSGSATAVQ